MRADRCYDYIDHPINEVTTKLSKLRLYSYQTMISAYERISISFSWLAAQIVFNFVHRSQDHAELPLSLFEGITICLSFARLVKNTR